MHWMLKETMAAVYNKIIWLLVKIENQNERTMTNLFMNWMNTLWFDKKKKKKCRFCDHCQRDRHSFMWNIRNIHISKSTFTSIIECKYIIYFEFLSRILGFLRDLYLPTAFIHKFEAIIPKHLQFRRYNFFRSKVEFESIKSNAIAELEGKIAIAFIQFNCQS